MKSTLRVLALPLIGCLASTLWLSPLGHAVEVVAGTGVGGFSGDGGLATAAQLNRPQAVVQGADGSLTIADGGNHRVRRIAPDGSISTVTGGETSTSLIFPTGLQVGADGELWIADAEAQRIFDYSPSIGLRSILGTGQEAPAQPSPTGISLLYPVAVLSSGENLLVSEMGSGRVLRLNADATLGIEAEGLGSPYGLATDVDGATLVADYAMGEVYRIVGGSAVSTASLVPPPSDTEDPPVDLLLPSAVAVGRDGSLYIATPDASAVYRLDGDGHLSVFLAMPDVSRPVGLSVTADSRLLIADEGRNQILSEALPSPAPLPGDADGSGKIDVNDALVALRLVVGSAPFQRRSFLASDVFPDAQGQTPAGDHRLTIQDVIRILRRAIGLDGDPWP